MPKRSRASFSYPAWVERLAFPAWVSSAEGFLCFLNPQAERLLGIDARRALGSPCHRVIRGLDEQQQSFCSRRCPIRHALHTPTASAPVRIHLRGKHAGTWVLLLTIPLGNKHGNGSSIVHCAVRCDREHRMEEYLKHLVHRGAPVPNPGSRAARALLTPREQEVLERLATGHRLRETSQELHVSYSTVRNHVQHVLSKLGAHSIQEAVALWLLRETVPDGGLSACFTPDRPARSRTSSSRSRKEGRIRSRR